MERELHLSILSSPSHKDPTCNFSFKDVVVVVDADVSLLPCPAPPRLRSCLPRKLQLSHCEAARSSDEPPHTCTGLHTCYTAPGGCQPSKLSTVQREDRSLENSKPKATRLIGSSMEVGLNRVRESHFPHSFRICTN